MTFPIANLSMSNDTRNPCPSFGGALPFRERRTPGPQTVALLLRRDENLAQRTRCMAQFRSSPRTLRLENKGIDQRGIELTLAGNILRYSPHAMGRLMDISDMPSGRVREQLRHSLLAR